MVFCRLWVDLDRGSYTTLQYIFPPQRVWCWRFWNHSPWIGFELHPNHQSTKVTQKIHLSIYLMEPGTGFHPHPCRLAEVPVPLLVSLPTCQGTCPLACLSPHLPRYPSPHLSLFPTCWCACPCPTMYLSPRLSPPSTCRHACSLLQFFFLIVLSYYSFILNVYVLGEVDAFTPIPHIFSFVPHLLFVSSIFPWT